MTNSPTRINCNLRSTRSDNLQIFSNNLSKYKLHFHLLLKISKLHFFSVFPPMRARNEKVAWLESTEREGKTRHIKNVLFNILKRIIYLKICKARERINKIKLLRCSSISHLPCESRCVSCHRPLLYFTLWNECPSPDSYHVDRN